MVSHPPRYRLMSVRFSIVLGPKPKELIFTSLAICTASGAGSATVLSRRIGNRMRAHRMDVSITHPHVRFDDPNAPVGTAQLGLVIAKHNPLPPALRIGPHREDRRQLGA